MAFQLGLDPWIPGKSPFDATKRPGIKSSLKITNDHEFSITTSVPAFSRFRVVGLCLNVKKAVFVKAEYEIKQGLINVFKNEVVSIIL